VHGSSTLSGQNMRFIGKSNSATLHRFPNTENNLNKTSPINNSMEESNEF